MKQAYSLLLALSIISLTACQTTGDRDSGGNIMNIREDKEATLADARLNAPLFIELDQVEYIQESRNRGETIRETYRNRNTGNSLLFTDYVTRGYFSQGAMNSINSRDEFIRILESINLYPSTVIEIGEGKLRYGGFYARLESGCIHGIAGKRIKGTTGYHGDSLSKYDTFIEFTNCEIDFLVSPEDFIANLDKMPKSGKAQIQRILAIQSKDDPTIKDWFPIAFTWEGYENGNPLLASYKVITPTASPEGGKFQLKLTIDGKVEDCTGTTTLLLSDVYMESWTFKCSNGLTAAGKLVGLGDGKGATGEGTDAKGNEIRFSFGGS